MSKNMTVRDRDGWLNDVCFLGEMSTSAVFCLLKLWKIKKVINKYNSSLEPVPVLGTPNSTYTTQFTPALTCLERTALFFFVWVCFAVSSRGCFFKYFNYFLLINYAYNFNKYTKKYMRRNSAFPKKVHLLLVY